MQSLWSGGLLSCSLIFFGLLNPSARAAQPLQPVISSWLDAQTNINSWSAEFVQTRALKTLTQPTTETGRVWFVAPNRFRWELGNPAKTIAVRADQDLLLIYPRLKRVERFPLARPKLGQWRDALSLLEAGFPRNQSEIHNQYNILAQQVTGDVCRLSLQPKSAAARKMIPQIKVEFDVKSFALLGTELRFADGSSMRNDFQGAVLNPAIDPKLFSPEIPSDYKVQEPL